MSEQPPDFDVETLTREFRWVSTLNYEDHQLIKSGRHSKLIAKLKRRLAVTFFFVVSSIVCFGISMWDSDPRWCISVLGGGIAIITLFYFQPRYRRLVELQRVLQQLPQLNEQSGGGLPENRS